MPPGFFVLGAVGFTGPFTQLPPKTEGGKGRDDLPYAEGAAVYMHTNNVHINTRAPHARHVHLINLSSLRSRSCTRGSFVLG